MSEAANAPVDLRKGIVEGGVASIRFFNGRLVVSGDMDREQEARRSADRRTARLSGSGVVRGLVVGQSGTDSVVVGSGWAASFDGRVLRLASDQTVRLVPPPVATPLASGGVGFAPCGVDTYYTQVSRPKGYHLLVLCPTSIESGKARVVAMDASTIGCNTDTVVEGVQFRLVALRGLDPEFPDEPADRGVRNRAAYLFLLPARTTGYGPDGEPSPDLLSRLLDYGATNPEGLQPTDVPLALVHFDAAGTLDLVDMWAVRRRIDLPERIPGQSEEIHPGADGARWADFLGSDLDSQGEARLLQFQDHLLALSSAVLSEHPELGPAKGAGGLAKETSLRVGLEFPYLPPCGFLPGWMDPIPFLKGALNADVEELVLQVDIGTARRLVAESLLHPPLERPGNAGANGPDRIHPVFRVVTIQGSDWSLFVQEQAGSRIAAEVGYDPKSMKDADLFSSGSGSDLPGTVQEALDVLVRANGSLSPVPRDAKMVHFDLSAFGEDGEGFKARKVEADVQDVVVEVRRELSERVGKVGRADGVSVGKFGGSEAKTVEEALAYLEGEVRADFARTVILRPDNFRTVLEGMSKDPDLNLVFDVGVFELESGIVLRGNSGGSLRIQGAGKGTQLRCGSGPALAVGGFESCIVRDLALEIHLGGKGASEPVAAPSTKSKLVSRERLFDLELALVQASKKGVLDYTAAKLYSRLVYGAILDKSAVGTDYKDLLKELAQRKAHKTIRSEVDLKEHKAFSEASIERMRRLLETAKADRIPTVLPPETVTRISASRIEGLIVSLEGAKNGRLVDFGSRKSLYALLQCARAGLGLDKDLVQRVERDLAQPMPTKLLESESIDALLGLLRAAKAGKLPRFAELAPSREVGGRSRGAALLVEAVREVRLEGISSRVPSSSGPGSAGIVVDQRRMPRGAIGGKQVGIRDCTAVVGSGQKGILVLDGDRVDLSGNTVRVEDDRASTFFPRQASYLAKRMAEHLAAIVYEPDPVPAGSPASAAVRTAVVEMPGKIAAEVKSAVLPDLSAIRFGKGEIAGINLTENDTDPAVDRSWVSWIPAEAKAWAKKRMGTDPKAPHALWRTVRDLRAVFLDPKARPDDEFLVKFATVVRERMATLPTLAARGIVVAGSRLDTVVVERNEVSDCAIGILLGLSERTEDPGAEPLVLGEARIRDNRVQVPDLAGHVGQRAAIHVGSFGRLEVSGNTFAAARQSWTEPVEGVRIWGWYGPFLQITRNTFEGFGAGEELRPLSAPDRPLPSRREALWNIDRNLVAGGKAGWKMPEQAVSLFLLEGNLPR